MEAPAGFRAASDKVDTAVYEFGRVLMPNGLLVQLGACYHEYFYDTEGQVIRQRVFDGSNYYIRGLSPITQFFEELNNEAAN